MKKSQVTVENLIKAGYVGKFYVASAAGCRTTDSEKAVLNIVEAVKNGIKVEFFTNDVSRKAYVKIPSIQKYGTQEWIERPYTDTEVMEATLRLAEDGIIINYTEE